MHESESDRALLASYAATGGNEAFRVLVERYSGLVFHTARRTLGDASLAEDVSQRVFVGLAKKAGQVARGGAPLPSWLHHATLLEAKAVLRAESRHARRKEALMDAPLDPPDSGDSAWRDALPHLDDAIDALPESDRHVLLLHFVNELTHAEIARRVGRSAAAVQKQSRRALEKLQQILGRRGIALTIGALTAGLTTEMTKAAPVLPTPVLGASIGKTTTSLFAVKKTTIAAVSATVLLCGVPLAYQETRIRKLEARIIDALPLAELAPRSRSTVSRGHSQVSYLQRLARDLNAQDSDVPRYVSAIDHVESLTNDELVALALKAAASSLPFEDQETIIGQVFRPLAKRDAELALDVLLMEIPDPYRGKSRRVSELMNGILRDYSGTNPQAALEWFGKNLAAIRSPPAREGSPEGWRETVLRQSLSHGFILADPIQAIEILRPVPSGEISRFLEQFTRSCEPSLRKNAGGYIEIARGLLPERESATAIAHLIHVHWVDWDDSRPHAPTEKLLETHQLNEMETEAVLRSLGRWRFQSASYGSADDFKAEVIRFHGLLEKRMGLRADRITGETLLDIAAKPHPEWIADILEDRDSIGMGQDAIAGFLTALENEPTLVLDPDCLKRIGSMVRNSEELQASFDRVLERYTR